MEQRLWGIQVPRAHTDSFTSCMNTKPTMKYLDGICALRAHCELPELLEPLQSLSRARGPTTIAMPDERVAWSIPRECDNRWL